MREGLTKRMIEEGIADMDGIVKDRIATVSAHNRPSVESWLPPLLQWNWRKTLSNGPAA